MHRLSSFRIIGTGVGLPDCILTNADIRASLNPEVDCSWVADRLGIHERRIASDGTSVSDMAAIAIKAALQQSEIDPSSIDLLIVATASGERKAPSTACLTLTKAGLTNAAAFDVNAVCSGFLYSLTTAAAFLSSCLSKRAIVVGVDIFSRITDWGRRDCIFFGDGAGAVILEASQSKNAMFDAVLYSNGEQQDAFTVHPGDSTFTMDAAAVFNAAVQAVPRCAAEVLQRNGLHTDNVDIVIPHQPSVNLLRKIAKDSGIPFEKFRMNMERYANTAGGTIPIILHETYENGSFKKDDLVLFAAAGAGFTAGAAIYRWQ